MTIQDCIDQVINLIAEKSNNNVPIAPQKNGDYVRRIPELIDHFQTEIATVTKRIQKTLYISQSPITPIGGIFSGFEVITHTNQDITQHVGLDVKGYYFEVDSTSTIYIEEEQGADWKILDTIDHKEKGKYKAYKGLINGQPGNNVRLRFSGQYYYHVRNVALFREPFESAEDVPQYTPFVKYQMPEDFFMLKDIQLENNQQRFTLSDFYWENQKILLLNYYYESQFVINYFAYPKKITKDAPLDTVLELDFEACNIIPYGVASIVKNDEDTVMSVDFRNMYETKLARLQDPTIYGTTEIQSTTGW